MKGRGIVTSIEGNKARVEVTTGTECMGCPSKVHCGLGAPEKREITVINDLGASLLDHIIFEAESGKVVLSAVLIWIVPLLAMIVGYLAAMRFSGGFVPIAAAFVFLGLAFGFLKLIDSKISGGRSFYPQIVRVISPSNSGADHCPEHEHHD